MVTKEEWAEIDRRIAAYERYRAKAGGHCPVSDCGYEPGTLFAGTYPCQRPWAGDARSHRDYLRGCKLRNEL